MNTLPDKVKSHTRNKILLFIVTGIIAISLIINFAEAQTNRIDIPTGVFVALQGPDVGVGISSYENKHTTWAHNPNDGRLYSMGGDFVSAIGAADSYEQEQYSLSIAERWANKTNNNAGWRPEYPYCGPNGGIQPKSPDFVGWTWDSKRKVFWFMPGTSVIPAYAVCSDRTVSTSDDPKYKFQHIMTFDPSQSDLTKRWRDISSDRGPYVVPPEQWMSHYDPTTDSIIRLSRNVSGDAVASHYNIQSNSWTTYSLGLNAVGRTMYIEKEGSAINIEGRVIYTGDHVSGRLYRYNINSHTITDLGPLPDTNSGNPDNNAFFAWDTVNRVLVYTGGDSAKLYVYHPDTSSWETPPQNVDPPGITPLVRHAMVFDPYQNVLAMLGNTYGVNYIFLYRYGNGTGPDTTPPAPPTGLRVTN